MDSLHTVTRGISAQRSLNAVKEYKITVADVVLAVISVGVYVGLYAIYHHFRSELQARYYANFAAQIANMQDLTDETVLTVAMEYGDITLSVVMLGGRQRIQIVRNENETDYLDGEITTLKQVQDRIRADILEDWNSYEKFDVSYDQREVLAEMAFQSARACSSAQRRLLVTPDSSELDHENIVSIEPQRGGAISQVAKVTCQSGDVFFFKPSGSCYNPGKFAYPALLSGISRADSRYEYRSLLTYLLSLDLDFHVIPETVLTSVFTSSNPRVVGYAQKKAPGESCVKVLIHCAKVFRSPEALLSNPIIVRKFIELQLLDALTGQADRHGGNIFVDLDSNAVFGIDNDICAGAFVTHPHSMLTVNKGEGYGRRGFKMSMREKSVIEHFKRQDASTRALLSDANGTGGEAVLLPPVMDTNMVSKIEGLNERELLRRMERLYFTECEQRAACHRLRAIKNHIRALGLRQQIGNLSIIHRDQWSLPEVRDKMFHANKGNNLNISTSYLQRELQFVFRAVPQII